MQLRTTYILHTSKYRETSLLIRLFSKEQGILGVVARGVLTKKSTIQSLLQPFQPLHLQLGPSKNLHTLYACELESYQPPLPNNTLLAGLYANEVLIRLCAEGDPHQHSHLAYCALLDQLRMNQNNIADTLRQFEWQVFTDTGYALNTSKDHAGAPLQAHRSYVLNQHWQFDEVRTGHYPGADLLAIHRKEFHLCRATAKRLSRDILSRIVGRGGLQSWKMFA